MCFALVRVSRKRHSHFRDCGYAANDSRKFIL